MCLGVNFKNLPSLPGPAAFVSLFHGGIGAVLLLYVLFWVKVCIFLVLNIYIEKKHQLRFSFFFVGNSWIFSQLWSTLASSASSLCLWAIEPYLTCPQCQQNRRLLEWRMQTDLPRSSVLEGCHVCAVSLPDALTTPRFSWVTLILRETWFH